MYWRRSVDPMLPVLLLIVEDWVVEPIELLLRFSRSISVVFRLLSQSHLVLFTLLWSIVEHWSYYLVLCYCTIRNPAAQLLPCSVVLVVVYFGSVFPSFVCYCSYYLIVDLMTLFYCNYDDDVVEHWSYYWVMIVLVKLPMWPLYYLLHCYLV